MRKIINYKGKKFIEYKEPILIFRSFDFALIFGLIIGSLKFDGWLYLIQVFLFLLAYIFISWMYEKEIKRSFSK